MKYRITICGALLAISLAGCATPYQKAGLHLAGGGFGEKKLSESAYWVYFSGNGYATKDRVVNFWIYRCAELTVQQGFQYMVLRPGEMPPVSMRAPSTVKPAGYRINSAPPERMHDAVFHPGDSGHLVAVRGGGYTYTYIPGATITTWNSRGTVLMYHAPLPEELVWAFDAKKILQLLGPYVTTDGSAPPPKIDDLSRQSLVAHEQIAFTAGAIPITAAPAPPASKPASATAAGAPPARDKAEILDQFENSSTAFHTLFRERKRLEHQEDAGIITVSFSITPNGTATGCQVASSTFPDKAFPDAVANLVCKMTFRPRDVAATLVPTLQIVFTPLNKALPT